MDKAPSVYPDLSDQTGFRLNTINKIKDYFIVEIRKKEAISKRLSKYIAAFDYFDKSVIVLSTTSTGVSIANIIGAPIKNSKCKF